MYGLVVLVAWNIQYDIIKTFKNPKTWVIMLLCSFFFFNQVLNMRSLAEVYQLGITPFVYPIFITSWRGRMYALILIVMVMGEAPYNNGAEVFISMRINRYKWFAGKLMYMISMSVIFQLVMVIVSVLVCSPYISMSNQCGDIIKTYVKGAQGMISAEGVVDSDGILSMSPMVSLMNEFVLMVLISIIIAITIFLINTVFKSIVGTVIVGVAVLTDIYFADLSCYGIVNIHQSFPTRWIDLNTFFIGKGWDFAKCATYMLIIIAVLLAVGILLVKKNVIKPVKNM